ncbi:MAG: methyltransferase domain-containing protein [Alphaproteobacteria bacterium]|nr:methyltransferase domain-containing protein [Alphaproteobacteria bacterium]
MVEEAPVVPTPPSSSEITIFDRKAIKASRERAAKNFAGKHDFLFKWTTDRLLERLEDVRREFPLALQIGSRGTIPPGQKPEKIGQMITLDNTDTPATPCQHYIQAEEEFLPFAPQTFDLILSTLNLHSINDLPGTLLQIRKALKPDGLFLAAMFGGETLHELRAAMMQTEMESLGGLSPRIFPFADKPQTGALLQRAGFALPVVDSEIVTVTYSDIFALMHDLRAMGENNTIQARDKTPPGKTFFMDTAVRYHNEHQEPDQRIPASFEIIFMIGWAPHASQQKPLPPGSAKHSLAEALSTKEIKTGEPAKP